VIKVNNITKTFNKGKLKALDGVSCTVPENKFVGLVGPDGAGKTTLLRIMAGIMDPDSGCITFLGEGQRYFEKPAEELHQIMSYMPQKFGLYEDLSVIENLTLYAELKGIPKTDRDSAFEVVLNMTNLNNFKDRLAAKLSGGMKQKLGLACSLLKKPRILILDEPSVGVDPSSRVDLTNMVHSMIDSGTTVIWSTAYMDEAEQLDHVILLNEGKTFFEGSPRDALKSVESRVFIINDETIDKRHLAHEILKKDYVVDSVIQGRNVRFVVNHNGQHDIEGAVQTRPTFEDACIDMLGGVQHKESLLESYMKETYFKSGSKDDIIVEAIKLTKKFGNFTAAKDISFAVKRSKILGLLGPNGAGKSTTFKMLCGLSVPTSGIAKIAGIDVLDLKNNAKINIGYMAQKFSLNEVLSVRQNLEFFAGAYRLGGKAIDIAVDKMIEIFHLNEVANTSSGLLSMGFKQRLSLACSIMHKPQVLFLDEPTSGVDPITRKEFWQHMNCMVRHGVSIVITTHFMDEAENCDDIALVYNGQVRATGSPDDLKKLCSNQDNPTLEQAFIQIISEVG
jgi:ABC-2 type transport system ATP-binding protein